jgi:hypothetical protein
MVLFQSNITTKVRRGENIPPRIIILFSGKGGKNKNHERRENCDNRFKGIFLNNANINKT